MPEVATGCSLYQTFRSNAFGDKLPPLILLAQVAFSATLLSFVREPVFYTGDGGMKLLATRQFANGVFTSELRLPAEEWVKRLWDHGYFPLEPPFVYEMDGRHVVGQPLTFPAASAPFYRLFGYRGLYVLPFASLVLLAAGMHSTARRLRLSAPAIAMVCAGWVTSYATLYSAMFWEHIPATMLAWFGVAPVVDSFSNPLSRRRMSVAGVLLGASAWLRPECLALAALVIIVWLPLAARRGAIADWAAFSGVTVGVVGGFLVLNVSMFGHPLGTHAFPTLNAHVSGAAHLLAAAHRLWFFATQLARFAPVVLLSLYFVARMRFRADPERSAAFYFAMAVGVLFLIAVSYMVPTEGGLQWGPRHVIPIVPVLSLAVGIGWQHAMLKGQRTERTLTRVVAIALVAYGIWINGWIGAHNLRKNYAEKIFPTIQLIEATGVDQIAVTDQYVTQEMAALTEDHRFYLVPADDQQPRRLADLADSLLGVGRRRFLVVVAIDEDAQAGPVPTLSNRANVCWNRRQLGQSASGYIVYEFSECGF